MCAACVFLYKARKEEDKENNKEDEEQRDEQKITEVPIDVDIELSKVSFKYIGSDQSVLKDLDLNIPAKKVTAIVGTSGSGKTTLMKLFDFYDLIGVEYLGNRQF